MTTAAIPQPQLQQTCKDLHPCAHLVAVNTQQEHDAIKAFVMAVTPTCQYLWTAGKTDNPVGLTDWYWELGVTTQSIIYCKSTNFGVLLYLANLVNCVFSLIFVAANIYVDRTLHRRAAERRQI